MAPWMVWCFFNTFFTVFIQKVRKIRLWIGLLFVLTIYGIGSIVPLPSFSSSFSYYRAAAFKAFSFFLFLLVFFGLCFGLGEP